VSELGFSVVAGFHTKRRGSIFQMSAATYPLARLTLDATGIELRGRGLVQRLIPAFRVPYQEIGHVDRGRSALPIWSVFRIRSQAISAVFVVGRRQVPLVIAALEDRGVSIRA
jgi:hypothetical protein